jgi:hypothetical protein
MALVRKRICSLAMNYDIIVDISIINSTIQEYNYLITGVTHDSYIIG